MKKNIALLTGGTTSERKVSIKSAATVMQNIDGNRYEVYKIMLNENSWFYEPADGLRVEVDKNDFSITVQGKKTIFDGVFIIIHGAPGEDGRLQGYFDMLRLPYTTCNALTSAITMNKSYTKAVVADIANLNVAKSVQVFVDNYQLEEIKSNLKLPLFVKPNNGGSSIGMSKVKHASELKTALDKAFKEDNQVLVEEFVEGREFSIGAYQTKGKIVVLPTTEVKTKNEFFDYDAKYTPGVTEEITPGEMTPNEKKLVEQVVADIYQKLSCRGVVRIDYFLERETGKFYFIEINTIPGQTATSFIPQQVAASGMQLKDFYSQILEETIG